MTPLTHLSHNVISGVIPHTSPQIFFAEECAG